MGIALLRRRPQSVKLSRDRDARTINLLLLVYVAFFLLALVIPLYLMISKSMHNAGGTFVGFTNYIEYFNSPALVRSIYNSFTITVISTVFVIFLAFGFAYSVTRTCMPFKGLFRLIALVPLLSPSLLAAIALIYWFGNQGVAKGLLMGETIYGPIGIVMASVFWTFPHAVMIILTALSLSDARLYEAAEVLNTSKIRTFFTITLPSVRYGLVSATIVIFILIFTDFGVPKVIGGNYNMLATDIYKEVIGQQNFEMGAVVSTVLLIPAVIAFIIDRLIQRKQTALLTARSVAYEPKRNRKADMIALAFCLFVSFLILSLFFMAAYASLVKFWPYNMALSFDNYRFESEGIGWEAFRNSFSLSFWSAMIGTGIIFFGAFLVEKPIANNPIRPVLHFLALLPLAVPGMVLGLAYIFFFNHSMNPLSIMYGTIAIMVLNTVTHFYSVSHLTAVTALKQIDREFESVSVSLKTSTLTMFFRVTLPISLPAILNIWVYLFVNAMTTVSGVIFLYSSGTMLASVGAIHLDEQGETAGAAAMAMLIVVVSVSVKLLHALVSKFLLNRTQSWRYRGA